MYHPVVHHKLMVYLCARWVDNVIVSKWDCKLNKRFCLMMIFFICSFLSLIWCRMQSYAKLSFFKPLPSLFHGKIFQLCSYEWLCVNLTNFSQFHYGFISDLTRSSSSSQPKSSFSRVQGLWSVAKPIRSFLMTLNLICHFLSTFSIAPQP